MGDTLAITCDYAPRITDPIARPRSQQLQLTSRDYEILRWITRHGMVISQQLARQFFGRDHAAIGKRRAYERIADLHAAGLLQIDRVYALAHRVLRVTGKGARLADVGLRPAVLSRAEIVHALSLVDLLDALASSLPADTRIVTERELRAARHAEMQLGTRRAREFGRMPDGLVVLPNGERVAVELDLTTKRVPVLRKVIQSLSRTGVDSVWWYVRAGRRRHVLDVVRELRADDYIDVREWYTS